MGPPFDIESYWRFVHQGCDSQANGFHASFLPILRGQSAIAMSKKATSRPCLGYVVFLACMEHWKKLSSADPFPFDTNVLKKSPARLGMSMEYNDHINSNLLQYPEDLVAFVRETGQSPMISPNPPMEETSKIKRKGRKTKMQSAPSKTTSPGKSPSVSGSSNADGNSTSSSEGTSTPESRNGESDGQVDSPTPAHEEQATQPGAQSNFHENLRSRPSMLNLEESNNQDHEEGDEEPELHPFGPSSLADLDQWAITAPSSEQMYREAPKLPTCGPWEIPLPSPMDPKVHVVPCLQDVQVLLGGIRIQTTQLPPRLKVELSGMQRAATHLMPDGELLADLTAIRWKAFRVLLSWAEHLKAHSSERTGKPLDIVSFVRSKLHDEGNRAREQAVRRIEKGAAGGGVMFPGEDYQMPLVKMVQRDTIGDEELPSSNASCTPAEHREQRKRHLTSVASDEDNDSNYSAVPACGGHRQKRVRHEEVVAVKQEHMHNNDAFEV
ncbi:hypothetical protein ACHAQH_005489 [Verticillium albo-atrum]